MNILLGLLLGAGAFLLWWSCWPVPAGEERPNREPKMVIMLRKAGMHSLSLRTFMWLSVGSAAITALVIFAVTSLPNLALLSSVAGFYLPRIVVSRRAQTREAKVWEQWPDAVDHLRSAIRAGLSLPEALVQLSYRGPEELRDAFARFGSDYRASGEFIPSLNRLKEYLADPVADTIIESLKIAREVGGSDLGRLLGTLSDFLRESSRTRAELQARQSWTVNGAKLACVAPWVVLMLMATQPAVRTVYNSWAGFILMLSGVVLSWIAYRLMLRIGTLPSEKRVFV